MRKQYPGLALVLVLFSLSACMFSEDRTLTVDGSVLYVYNESGTIIVGYKGNDEKNHIARVDQAFRIISDGIVDKAEFFTYYSLYSDRTDTYQMEYREQVAEYIPPDEKNIFRELFDIDRFDNLLILLLNNTDGHGAWDSKIIRIDTESGQKRIIRPHVNTDKYNHISAICSLGDGERIVMCYKSQSIQDQLILVEIIN